MKFDLRYFASVGSTQDVCRLLAEQGAAEGVVVVAEEQTAGRGRVGHTWFSPAGQAIYASMLLRPVLAVNQAHWLTMIAALAVTDALADLAASVRPAATLVPQPTIKWFNDVLLGDKKVCGILVETAMTDNRLDYAVVGIGLNANTDFDEAPDEVRARAISLRAAWNCEGPIDRAATLQRVLAQFAQRYTHLIDTQHSPAPSYAERLDTLGKWVRVQSGDAVVEGIAQAVDDWGGLCVNTDQGARTIYFGQVLSAVAP